ncbi:hypothetical protein SAMN04489761_3077 [Tenacibaculum sp. MAR_2009_124]|uniref:hypothetical protein n=1 Tax=Tenacibaculum sp. MAR_2009_124 TaxID=1250059 RepID=UPI00089A2954|nr:hypothetical protein [Tenacibaculum sp. MAR_2009_124]SEC46839.1 hypothetical protein SAMN04489761_3077 [Tenacibaculum sp. MAR_2009_124]
MKPIKIKATNIEDIELPNHDIMYDVIGRLNNDLNKQLDDSVIEGLKRKGFEFKHHFELEAFIKERCRCEDNTELKERVYYVDNIPFFLHNYKSEIITDPSRTGDPNMIVGELGTFAYL